MVKIEELIFIPIREQKLKEVSIDIFDKESMEKAPLECYILYSILSSGFGLICHAFEFR